MPTSGNRMSKIPSASSALSNIGDLYKMQGKMREAI